MGVSPTKWSEVLTRSAAPLWLLVNTYRKMSLNYALGLLMYSCRFCS